MARRLGTSITETERLVGCSRSAVVSIHAKWINDGDTSNIRQGVGRPRVIKEKGRRSLSHLVKQNRRQTMAQLTTQYNSGPNASVSEDTIQRTLLDMGLCSRRLTRVPLLTKRRRQLRLQWAREHRDWTMDECRSYTGWWWRYYALGDVLIGGSQTRSCSKTDHESYELSKHHCGSVTQLHGVCLPNWKWNLPARQRPMSQGSDCVGVVLGAYDEIHLMSWPRNLPDLNPMEHIWDVMKRQLRAQTPTFPNISTLRERYLDIWYNLSPVMFKNLWHLCPGELQLF
ncbi:hypothetical protein AVEN_132362-1 [Araneus ventricosus]|uniref:Transposase Tc1-like domain-containing protein n=1 Tax=Araneus ventricosus TaxID=182803 RepID=A0A4Y2XD26_ARAVE|nr:hypothetical protein AVEN_114464-1 [Araneus ventricosus]GBO46201.1 hypothetical protein AVEN_132362-1 [Araneus ventricosus]